MRNALDVTFTFFRTFTEKVPAADLPELFERFRTFYGTFFTETFRIKTRNSSVISTEKVSGILRKMLRFLTETSSVEITELFRVFIRKVSVKNVP